MRERGREEEDGKEIGRDVVRRAMERQRLCGGGLRGRRERGSKDEGEK